MAFAASCFQRTGSRYRFAMNSDRPLRAISTVSKDLTRQAHKFLRFSENVGSTWSHFRTNVIEDSVHTFTLAD